MDALTAWPTALVPALRQVWSRTLFAGPSARPERPTLVSLFVLIVLPAALLYPWLQFRLLEPDEGRYAEIPREMLARGDWVVPVLQGEPYLDKPPILYWSVMISYSIFGVHDWAARIPPAIAVHGTIFAIYLFGCRMLGQRRALRAAILLSVMPGLTSIGRLLNLDGMLTLWVTLGLLAGYQFLVTRSRPMFLLWTLACGLGVLTKGPIALVLVLVPQLTWRWLNSEAKPVSRRDWLLFLAGIMAINLPWYVAIAIREQTFVRYFFWQHNIQRFLTPFDHLQPIWYYCPILAGCLFPAVLWLAPIIRSLISGESAIAARRSRELSFCLLAGGFCVIFFSLSGCKLPTYILPALPMLALALGVLLETGNGLFTKRQWLVGGTWLALMVIGHAVLMPAYARQRSPLREESIVRQHCGDLDMPVACFPRQCNSVSFYLGRDDMDATRTKNIGDLINECYRRPRTVILFSHRHSLESFQQALPPHLNMKVTTLANFRSKNPDAMMERLLGGSPWGLSAIAAVESGASP